MQKDYQDAADKLQQAVEEAVTALRKQLAEAGLDLEKIPKQPMAVEIVSFVLAKCLIDERLTFSFGDEQQARKEAMAIVKAAVIQYRGKNLAPPPKHLTH
ncbi:MAG: hypothetical protein DRR08_04385 [Candidatus Parabeggiatoa sp. nov. 2]|nr:MAG: hypothetical protein B6247_07645 [Beggiatoa sp. 4572_84]RKZ63078.1 MAG: hypothetical protein DRR08_04385 [Gammaproteobacteria bacterium]